MISNVEAPAAEAKAAADGRGWRVGGKLLLSGFLLYWVLRGASLGEVLGAIRSADPVLVLFAFSFSFVGYVISITRWRLLLGAHAVHPTFPTLLQAYVVALFFNNLLPSTVGGDAVRAYDSWRFGASRSAAVTVVFTDRVLGVVALLLFATAGLLVPNRIADGVPLLRPAVGLLLLGIAGLLLVVVAPRPLARVGRSLDGRLPGRLRAAGSTLRKATLLLVADRRLMVRCLGLSLLLQLNVVVQYVVLAMALPVPVPGPYFFVIVPLAVLVMMLPITINAIGIRENVFVFFFGFFGVPAAVAVAYAWIAYGFQLTQAVLGGIVHLLRK